MVTGVLVLVVAYCLDNRGLSSAGGTNAPKRALLVIRLRRVTDATTSPERQLVKYRKLCQFSTNIEEVTPALPR